MEQMRKIFRKIMDLVIFITLRNKIKAVCCVCLCAMSFYGYAKYKYSVETAGDYTFEKTVYETGRVKYFVKFKPKDTVTFLSYLKLEIPFDLIDIYEIDNIDSKPQWFDLSFVLPMKNLWSVHLYNVNINPLSDNIQLPTLIRSLQLIGTDITDNNCRVFGTLKNLDEITIVNAKNFKGYGLSYLCKDQLTEVNLDGSNIDESAFKALADLPYIEVVRMNNVTSLSKKQIAEYYAKYLGKKNVRIYYQNERNQ